MLYILVIEILVINCLQKEAIHSILKPIFNESFKGFLLILFTHSLGTSYSSFTADGHSLLLLINLVL